jgi:hypothetical protein
VVVDDQQGLAAGLERGGGGGALVGVERGAFLLKRGAGPQLDRAVLTANRWPLGSNAMLVTGPAATATGPAA